MKRGLKHRGRYIVMKCSEMSHASAGGEYELGISEQIELDLDNMRTNLASLGYESDEIRPGSVSLLYRNATITVLKTGKILIQDLLPDTCEEAMRIGMELMNAEQEM